MSQLAELLFSPRRFEVTSYVDTTITLSSSSSPANTYQYLFPADPKPHPVWVGIANQSQGAIVLQTVSNHGPGEPPTNIDPGQPYLSQVDFYMLTITGSAGQIFNIKIQDEPLVMGKTQTVSVSGSQAPSTTSGALTFPAGATTTFGAAPKSGTRWRIWGVGVTLTNGSVVAMAISAIGFQIYDTTTGLGIDWSKTESWSLNVGDVAAWTLGPTGVTNPSGSFALLDIIALLPFVITVESWHTLAAAVTLTAGGANPVATMVLIPLGVEEPL